MILRIKDGGADLCSAPLFLTSFGLSLINMVITSAALISPESSATPRKESR